MVKDKIKTAVMIDVTQASSITYNYDVTYITRKETCTKKGLLES